MDAIQPKLNELSKHFVIDDDYRLEIYYHILSAPHSTGMPNVSFAPVKNFAEVCDSELYNTRDECFGSQDFQFSKKFGMHIFLDASVVWQFNFKNETFALIFDTEKIKNRFLKFKSPDNFYRIDNFYFPRMKSIHYENLSVHNSIFACLFLLKKDINGEFKRCLPSKCEILIDEIDEFTLCLEKKKNVKYLLIGNFTVNGKIQDTFLPTLLDSGKLQISNFANSIGTIMRLTYEE